MAGTPLRIGVWMEASQGSFVRGVLQRAGMTPVIAGSPIKGQSGQCAAELACASEDDLRSLLTSAECDAVWIASAGGFASSGEALDSRAVLAARARGVRVLVSDPVPPSILHLHAAGWEAGEPSPSAGAWLRTVALPRQSKAVREAQEVLAAFGPARAAHIECWCAAHHGSLGGRLLACADFILGFLGEPETIDAAYVGRTPLPRDSSSLAGLHGDVLATMRFEGGRAATLCVSNAAGRWGVGVTLISDLGRLRFFDDGFEWVAPDGTKRDESRVPGGSRGALDPEMRATAAVGDSLARLVDRGLPDEGPINLASVLAIGQAALLSARTGQPESPAAIRAAAVG